MTAHPPGKISVHTPATEGLRHMKSAILVPRCFLRRTLQSIKLHSLESGSLDQLTIFSLSIYLGRFPQFGGSRQHKRNNKNNGGFTPFFQQWRGGTQPSLDGTAGATQPILPRLPQLTSLHRCHLPYCPYQSCLYKATPWQQQMPIRTASQSFATHSYS